MTMSPMYHCGKPCSTETHNATKLKTTDPTFCIYQSNYDGLTASNLESRSLISNHSFESGITVPDLESQLRIWNLVRMLSIFLESHIKFAFTIEIHKSRNLIGTLGSSEFRPKA